MHIEKTHKPTDSEVAKKFVSIEHSEMKIETPVNINYCATVVSIDKFVPIENADRIQYADIFTNKVIVGKDIEPGTVGLYFPIETEVSQEFLSEHNLLRYWKLNKANYEKVKGFFESKGRVRAVRLRGNKSEGFFMPLDTISEKYDVIKSLTVGTEFDKLGDEVICKKYIVKTREPGMARQGKQGSKPRFSRLVENQFRLHIDTINAKRGFSAIVKPSEIVSLTNKLHGTSAVFANLLTQRPKTIKEKIQSFFGVNVNTTEYGSIYSSRKVVKNKHINEDQQEGFYKVDLWGKHNDDLKDVIPKGVSVYGEIVGYVNGTEVMVQKGYHYGEEVGQSKFYAYRVTSTNADGDVFEFTWQQVKDFCMKYSITHVPEFYYGLAKDIYPDIPVNDEWHGKVIERLSTDYNLEKPCAMNNDEVPAEGLVIRPERLYDCVPLKLKAFAFLENETKQLDSGEVDIESQESEEFED